MVGSGIRNPGSGKTYSGSRIRGEKRYRIPDPDPQHCFCPLYSHLPLPHRPSTLSTALCHLCYSLSSLQASILSMPSAPFYPQMAIYPLYGPLSPSTVLCPLYDLLSLSTALCLFYDPLCLYGPLSPLEPSVPAVALWPLCPLYGSLFPPWPSVASTAFSVSSLQYHMIPTMSHWPSGLPVCFPSQGTQGVLM
jgi:hypothetical protein